MRPLRRYLLLALMTCSVASATPRSDVDWDPAPLVSRCVLDYSSAIVREPLQFRSWLVLPSLDPTRGYVQRFLVGDADGTQFTLLSRATEAGDRQIELTAEDEMTGREWKYEQPADHRSVAYDPALETGAEILISSAEKGRARLRCAPATP